MGRQIVYCDGCGKLLREQDFDQGRAHVVENRNYCVECKPLPKPPSSTRVQIPSSAKLPILPPAQTPRSLPKISPGSSTRFNPVQEAPPRTASKGPLLTGLGIAALVVVVALALLLSGGGGRREEERVPEKHPPSAGPTHPEGSKPPPPAPLPGPSPLEEAAKSAYAEALDHQRRNEKDLGGQLERFERLATAYKGTSVAEEALRASAKVREQIRNEVAALDAKAGVHRQTEEYGKAIALVEAERGRYNAAEWASSVQEMAVRLRSDAGKLYGQFKAGAVQAKRKGDAVAQKTWTERVARLGIAEYTADLAVELDRVRPDAPDVPRPPTPAVSPALEAYRAGWAGAMALAAARDPAGALAALEKLPGDESVKAEREADLALLKALQQLHAEAPALLAKTPKGQKAAVEYWDASGNPAKLDDAVARIDAHRIEVKQGAGSLTVSYGELRARTLAAAWLARPGKKPEDGKAAALACALEGDLDGPAALGLPGVEQRVSVWASTPPAPEAAAKEAAARGIFHRAEIEWFDFARTEQAADAYKALLAEHGETAFVRRNRAAIASRTEIPKEFFYLPPDLGTAGGFKAGKSKKVESCWTSEKDLDAAQRRANFVEVSFPVAAGTPYRCWFYVGGCCQEVFSFFAQGTEMAGPDPKNPKQTAPAEPGSEVDVSVKHSITGLKRRHQDHLGPKEPDRWDWVSVPLPKYASAGTKRVRLVTDQKGFSVAYAVVSSTRVGAPLDRDVAAQEKLRGETPGFASQGPPSVGVILREWWSEIPGGDVASLTGNPKFPNEPTGFEFIPAFDTPIDTADNYGSRVRGYVLPPATGDYVFWICTDDGGELWLSTDESPANKRKIASVPGWAGPEEWEKNGAQKSGPVKLEAGKRYYIEGLQKEGQGGDHLRVGWQLPDGKQERPIPGSRLAPAAPPRK
jgi:hypothetical protein